MANGNCRIGPRHRAAQQSQIRSGNLRAALCGLFAILLAWCRQFQFGQFCCRRGRFCPGSRLGCGHQKHLQRKFSALLAIAQTTANPCRFTFGVGRANSAIAQPGYARFGAVAKALAAAGCTFRAAKRRRAGSAEGDARFAAEWLAAYRLDATH